MADKVSSITKWQTGTDIINDQNCFAVNFGYTGEFPLPTINLQLDISQNLTQHKFGNLYKCFFVLVGVKSVEDMKTISNIVEDVSKQFHGIKPISMFIFGKSSDEVSSIGHELTKVNTDSNVDT